MFKLNDVGMAAIRAWLACVTDGSESVGMWALAAERSANRQEGDWVFVEVELPAARSLLEQPKGLVLLRSDFVLGESVGSAVAGAET